MGARKNTAEFIEQAAKLHSGRYNYTFAIYVSAHIKISIICATHGEFLQTPHNHLKGQGCPHCMAIEKFDNLRLTNEEIDEFLLVNKITIKRIGNYKNIINNIEWQCLWCSNIWLTTPNHIRRGGGCPICKDTRLSNDDIDQFILENHLSLKRIGDYINNYTKINWQCLECDHIWLAQPCEIKRLGENREGSGCPECSRGKNEKRVAETLKELNLEYSKIRIDLPTGQKLFPDFYLPKLNLIIEYNGIQHYQPICFGNMNHNSSLIKFNKQLSRDQQLRDYCNLQNIILLEIDGRIYKSQKLKKFVKEYFSTQISVMGANYV